MWSYYGSKSKIIKLYPKPKYDKIIEPFAGTARYSLRYFEKDVLLIDKYDVVVKIWKWLQLCSPNDILKLPKLKIGDNINEMNLSEEEKLFLGMEAAVASLAPRNKVTKFSSEQNVRHNRLRRISSQLFKIKHWKIKLGNYDEINNQKATWFIDPPYQFGGHSYVHSNKNLNYEKLAMWCKERLGQTIVCENTKANWMDFNPMKKIKGASNIATTEAIWSNVATSYNVKQLNLINDNT